MENIKSEIKKFSKYWQRIVFKNKPIYINPQKPDWFVPNKAADDILKLILEKKDMSSIVESLISDKNSTIDKVSFEIQNLFSGISFDEAPEYKGRSDRLKLSGLKEVWFHLTNRCNLSCSHCMFASGPQSEGELNKNEVLKLIDDAKELGCKIYYFTGGEPFVYHGFMEICRKILDGTDSHVVVLTNGLLLPKYREFLEKLPADRFHLQISVDGDRKNHDRIRGRGSYEQLSKILSWLKTTSFGITLSMAVDSGNVHAMSDLVNTAKQFDITSVHYMWYFVTGKGIESGFADPSVIFESIQKAQILAEKESVVIDNVEIIKSQVFSPPSTRYDLNNSGWESVAVGPDLKLYPSPALIGVKELASDLKGKTLSHVWRNSPVLDRIRSASVANDSFYKNDPLRFLTGGGDIDHSYYSGKTFTGKDPYQNLYNNIACWLILHEAEKYKTGDSPGIRLRMGEKLDECSIADDSGIAFTHSNCVLSISGADDHSLVRSFYTNAAENPNKDILNPVHYKEDVTGHIPDQSLVRSYGCGSPVTDAQLQPGEVVADLGCGAGVECFIAARYVGKEGRVYGIDMADKMLDMANKSKARVVENIGYDNILFKKGFLESLPLKDKSCDVIISNCVVNLSNDKRRVFSEIIRVLKPGGRLIISDVVAEREISAAIKHDETLRGECIADSLTGNHMLSLISDVGFKNSTIIKRFFYREVQGYRFFSLTFSAFKAAEEERYEVMYRGPFAAVITESGDTVIKGKSIKVNLHQDGLQNDSVFLLDEQGNVTNSDLENTCSCFIPPDKEPLKKAKTVSKERHSADCMVCGAHLNYLDRDTVLTCFYCGTEHTANAVCENGHFICDDCHSEKGLKVIEHICTHTQETDMLKLLEVIHNHRSIPLHGPEHHAMVPAIILATFRNLGGNISDDDISAGIERGKSISGGACAFMGICGAASGVGTAFSVILKSNPYKGGLRKIVQTATKEALADIADLDAARCCQRDSAIALIKAAELSSRYLDITLKADYMFECRQFNRNKECIHQNCMFWPERVEV